MPTIASHLTTVGELDSELSTLQTALGDLRTSYLSALASATDMGNAATFQHLGQQMRLKTEEIVLMHRRIQDYFNTEGAITLSFREGQRYTP